MTSFSIWFNFSSCPPPHIHTQLQTLANLKINPYNVNYVLNTPINQSAHSWLCCITFYVRECFKGIRIHTEIDMNYIHVVNFLQVKNSILTTILLVERRTLHFANVSMVKKWNTRFFIRTQLIRT